MNRRSRSLPRWLDALAIVAAAAVMIAWTWRTWPDPLVDFGRELYVPWQINIGHMLYRDIAYFNGPLSPYLNGLWMRLFGVSLTTLISANLAIIAAIIAMLYALLNLAADRLSALVCSLFFIAVFAFGRIVGIGNYNFVCPYSHEITHGLALSLCAIACLFFPRQLTAKAVSACGLLTGLALLTKVEVAFACVVAVATGFTVRRVVENSGKRSKLVGLLCATTALPSLIAFLLLSIRLPAGDALDSTFGSFYWALHSNVAASTFYRHGLGLDHLQSNLKDMAIGAVLLCGAALWAAIAALLVRRVKAHNTHAAALAFILTAAAFLLTRHSLYWFNVIPKALPVAMAALLIIATRRLARSPRTPGCSRVLGLRITLFVFALALLGKIFFNTRLYHYGFALAMPAMLMVIAAFLGWLPRLLATHSGDFWVARSVALAGLVVMVFIYLSAESASQRDLRYAVGSGPDLFYSEAQGKSVQSTVEWLTHNTPPGSSVAVLPDAVMINYLSRRPAPGRYLVFLPPEVMMFGEQRIISDFSAHPPDFVVLVQDDSSEYGLPLFAHDYGQEIAAWVLENYQPAALLGDPPLVDLNHFGILILRKRTASNPPVR